MTQPGNSVPDCILENEKALKENEKKDKSEKLLKQLNSDNPEFEIFNQLYVKYRDIEEPLSRMEFLKDVQREDIASLREIYLKRYIQMSNFYLSHLMSLKQYLYTDDSQDHLLEKGDSQKEEIDVSSTASVSTEVPIEDPEIVSVD